MADLPSALAQAADALAYNAGNPTVLGQALRAIVAAAREAEKSPLGVREAFVAGAAWWEYHTQGATIWTGDRRLAEGEAERRFPTSEWIESPRLTAAEGYARELESALATEREKSARLTAVCNESNAVCACGCPESEHESYDEDGESCGVEGHDCVRTSRSVAAMLATERRRREEAEARLTRIREWVGGLGWLGGPQDERVEDECLAILDGEPHV